MDDSPGTTGPGGGHILDRLFGVIESRRGADPAISHTARLFHKGTRKIAQKVGEEAVETVIEAVRNKRERLIEESADLMYHLLVLWADARINRGARASPALPRRNRASAIDRVSSRSTDGLRHQQHLREDPARRDSVQEGL
jgi:phosphoribosyl-ATP pyrophosphohydrolase